MADKNKTGTEEYQELMELGDDSNVRQTHISSSELKTGDDSNVRQAHISSNEMITELASDFHVDTDESAKKLIADGVEDLNKSKFILIRSGIRLRLAKDKCSHGEFGKICGEFGINRYRASEAMRYAEHLSLIPKKQRESFLSLPKKSALLIGSSDPAVIEFLLDDENHQKAKLLKNKTQLAELVEDLNSAHQINEKLNTETITLQEKVDALQDQLEMGVAGSDLPPWCALFRKEVPVLAEEANADLLSIETLSTNYLMMIDMAGDKKEMYHNAAVIPAVAHVASIARNALSLFSRMCEAHSVKSDEIAVFTVPMEADELEAINLSIAKMLRKRTARAIEREDSYRRDKSIKFSPGRPAKPS